MIQRQQMDVKRMGKTAEKSKNKMKGRFFTALFIDLLCLRGFSFLIAEQLLNLFCKL